MPEIQAFPMPINKGFRGQLGLEPRKPKRAANRLPQAPFQRSPITPPAEPHEVWASTPVIAKSLNYEMPGWGGRIRTSGWRNQNPLPYHLATPQRAARLFWALAESGRTIVRGVSRRNG
jgi:hypothetical protein